MSHADEPCRVVFTDYYYYFFRKAVDTPASLNSTIFLCFREVPTCGMVFCGSSNVVLFHGLCEAKHVMLVQ